jgi:hypothetical protein
MDPAVHCGWHAPMVVALLASMYDLTNWLRDPSKRCRQQTS